MLNAPIELTPAEQKLAATINFDAASLRDYHQAQRNGEAALELAKSLAARKAIPKVRLSYFTDPTFNPGGRGRSRKQNFERNGCVGDDVLTHPNFLKFLRYFIFGADLPPQVVTEFRNAIDECGHVTSSDVIPLGRVARQLARANRLKAHEACEEFYKLALDCGLWHSHAEHIRDAVRKMR